MTDNEIIKALEEWIKALKDDYKRLQLLDAPMDCFEESHTDNIRVLSNALDLINRQKANAEGLTNAVKFLNEKVLSAKAEAVKEFSERLKEKLHLNGVVMGSNCAIVNDVEIDNLVKEMAGEEK